MAKTVTVIPPKEIATEQSKRKGPLRVAAYCRVSTDDEEQLTSYNNQIEYYTELIEGTSNWRLADIFADEGLSGTNTKKRPEFNRLMSACRRGRVDHIITKSVSRFARNTVDCLHYVRMLKELGISVYFQKESIDTSDMSSEMMLTIFSSFAQAESESISANVSWGVHKSFREGKVTLQYTRLIGYRKGADGEPEIEPEGAKVVRRIFRAYLAGQSVQQIKEGLEQDKIAPPGTSTEWRRSHILNILQNEKYMGDALLQKTYTTDCISGKVKRNRGELPQYYVTDNHPAIIPRELFHRVQEEIAKRNSKPRASIKPGKTNRGRFSCKYALTEIMRCAECGAPYRRVTWTAREQKRIVWRCLSRLEAGKDVCMHSPTLPEPALHDAILRGIQQLVELKEDFLKELSGTISSVVGGDCGLSYEQLEAEVKKRNDMMLETMAFIEESGADVDDFNAKFQELAGEISEFRRQQAVLTNNADRRQRMMEIDAALEQADIRLDEYSDELVRMEVEEVLVRANVGVKIKFKNGQEVVAGV